MWGAHGDPAIWWNSGNVALPATGPNLFFYDSAFTLPVSSFGSGGSQPAAFVLVAVVYVFAEGESVLFAISGTDYRFPSTSPVQTRAAAISVPANNFLTIKSPPAVTGATGWVPYISVVPYSSGFGPVINGTAPPLSLSPQVSSPIAIGTDWTQATQFREAARQAYNFYKQTASPVTMGTDSGPSQQVG